MSARADPCGGRSAMVVPTATANFFLTWLLFRAHRPKQNSYDRGGEPGHDSKL